MNNFIKLMRPKQWIKNSFVLAPLLFSLQFTNLHYLSLSIIAVLSFIAVSSATYIFNDICDIEEDRTHPIKKLRPIASGKVKITYAAIIAIILIIIAFTLSIQLNTQCSIVLLIYMVMNFIYTKHLKHHAIADVLVIASGFVLRVLMGGYAISVYISPWIILTTFLLALFLGFCKRYSEIAVEEYSNKRNSLQNYSKELLDRLIGISCACALISYALYTVETARLNDRTELVYTVIFVVYGLFRYLQLVYINKKGGEPEKIIFSDKPFIFNIIAWIVFTLGILS